MTASGRLDCRRAILADAQGVIELAKERFTKSLWNMKSRLLTVRVDAFDYRQRRLTALNQLVSRAGLFRPTKYFTVNDGLTAVLFNPLLRW